MAGAGIPTALDSFAKNVQFSAMTSPAIAPPELTGLNAEEVAELPMKSQPVAVTFPEMAPPLANEVLFPT